MNREVQARRSIEAFNHADWTLLRELTADGLVYEETGSGRRVDGREAVIETFRAWRVGLPDATGEITRLLVDGDVTVLEIRWRGTHTGPLVTPGGTLEPTGRPFEAWSTLWQRWADGLITHERHHLDLLTMLAQLGAVPAPASA